MKWIIRDIKTDRLSCIISDETEDGTIIIDTYGDFVCDEYRNGFTPILKQYDDGDTFINPLTWLIEDINESCYDDYDEDDYDDDDDEFNF